MKYKGTRQLLTGILAVMLTIPVIVGLASPIRTQAASKVGVSTGLQMVRNMKQRTAWESGQ